MSEPAAQDVVYEASIFLETDGPPPVADGPASPPVEPSEPSDPRSFLARFCDRFLQEQNIKWILALGVLILTGSSIKLVASGWEGATAVWKHLVLVGYTGATFGIAQFCYWRLGLRKTGTVLMALGVLLVPISFLGLHWVLSEPPGAEALGPAAKWLTMARNLALLAGNCALGWIAARRVFDHFLRGPQPTFAASYLLLSAAAALVPLLNAGWWPLTALALWGVFVAGTVKVNRHVFWLAEEYRLPRIFGFFPIALLGTQFLTLFAWQVQSHMPWQWLGLACVLVALPVLLTADAVARVFEQRAGRLARPLPAAIILPLLLGLVLCLTGVALAAICGFPQPQALVPTAALAAVMLGVMARRTGHAAFVWSMLAGVVLAYNFSYVFFVDLARRVIDTGAAAVHEQRLPFAFYGLTYLPLLLAATGCATWLERRRRTDDDEGRQGFFAAPLRRFATGLSCLLLLAATTNLKALLPVSLAMTGMFALQTVLFRDRQLIVPAIAGFLAAAAGVTPFVATVLQWRPIPAELPWYCLTAAAAALLGPGGWIDGRLRRLPERGELWRILPSLTAEAPPPTDWCQRSSLAVTLVIGLAWFGWSCLGNVSSVSAFDLAITGLLAAQALRRTSPWLGGLTLAFLAGLGLLHALLAHVSWRGLETAGTIGLISLWLGVCLLERRPQWRLSQTFGPGAAVMSLLGLTGLALVFLCSLALAIVVPAQEPLWLCSLAVLGWSFDAARRTMNPLPAFLGAVGVPLWIGAAWVGAMPAPDAYSWLWSVWGVTGVAALAGIHGMQRITRRARLTSGDMAGETGGESLTRAIQAVTMPVECIAVAGLVLIGAASLTWLTGPARTAGALAAVGLALHGVWGGNVAWRRLATILANWQGLALIAGWFAPEVRTLFDLAAGMFGPAALPVAAAAALSALAFRWTGRGPAASFLAEWEEAHAGGLRLAAGALLVCRFLTGPDALSGLEVALALSTFAALAGELLEQACRRVDAGRVWLAEAVVAAAVVFLWRFEVIALGRGISMYVVFASAVLFWIAGRLAASRPALAVLARPFRQTALVLPLGTVALGLGRHLLALHAWPGGNSLALLLAAGFYFWRGLEERDKPLIVVAAAIVNLAWALLWSELRWLDPQFWMIPLGLTILGLVELLRREIPAGWLDPLRYAGALTVLVSPTFEIVHGSWLHLATLMVAAVAIALLAIGLRIRALMYTGTAFLLADLAAMVVVGSAEHPNLPWIVGIALGSLVLLLGAVCENHREVILQRLRMLTARLETWQ